MDNGMFGKGRKPAPVEPAKSPFIEQFQYAFVRDIGVGGCHTCGNGEVEGMCVDSFNDMLKEMDVWITTTYGKPE